VVPEQPATRTLVLGEQRGPYEASSWDEEGSTLGGHPDWIQEPRFPRCPTCTELMDYVALVAGADLYQQDQECAYYIFLHAPCSTAATIYQQT
jgi:hypothetical protein